MTAVGESAPENAQQTVSSNLPSALVDVDRIQAESGLCQTNSCAARSAECEPSFM